MKFAHLIGLMMLPLVTVMAQVKLEDVKDHASLEKVAAQLAAQPYVAPSQKLDPFFEGLKYDGHRDIRFQPSKALFSDIGDVYRLEFFHPGWMFKKPVRFFTMREGATRAVPFDRSLFDYGKLIVPPNVVNPEGYAGFRVLAPEALQKRRM